MGNFSGGYVGDSSDQIKIRRFEKQRAEKRKHIEELQKISHYSLVNAGTRQFATASKSLLEQKFSEDTVGLVSKAEFSEKRRTLEKSVQGEEYQRSNHKDELQRKIHQKQYEEE